VLPHVSENLPTGVVFQSEQLAKLITCSERLSKCAYASHVSDAVREKHRREISRIIHDREKSGNDDCIILEEAPPAKRSKLDASSKWEVVTDTEEWAGCEPGLCPGQEDSSNTLHLNFLHPQSECVHQNTISPASKDERGYSQRTFSKIDVARIQAELLKYSTPLLS
jgi:hypothetical protein